MIHPCHGRSSVSFKPYLRAILTFLQAKPDEKSHRKKLFAVITPLGQYSKHLHQFQTVKPWGAIAHATITLTRTSASNFFFFILAHNSLPPLLSQCICFYIILGEFANELAIFNYLFCTFQILCLCALHDQNVGDRIANMLMYSSLFYRLSFPQIISNKEMNKLQREHCMICLWHRAQKNHVTITHPPGFILVQ